MLRGGLALRREERGPAAGGRHPWGSGVRSPKGWTTSLCWFLTRGEQRVRSLPPAGPGSPSGQAAPEGAVNACVMRSPQSWRLSWRSSLDGKLQRARSL